MGSLSNYWYCHTCLLGWMKKAPKTTYEQTYYVSGSSLLSRLFQPVMAWFYRHRVSCVGKDIKKRWVDVGAGEGGFLLTVPAREKIGIEISKSGREIMEDHGLKTMTNAQFLKAKNLRADVISFWQVLEHVDEPKKYLEAAVRNLAPKGKIVVAVPNIDSLEFPIFQKRWFHLAPRFHLWFFSPRSLALFGKDVGLRVEKVDYFAIEHHLTGLIQSCLNKTTGSEDLLHKLVKRRQNLSEVTPSQTLWIIFWCTFGLPLILLWWIYASLRRKPGTFVMILCSNKNKKTKDML